MILVGNLGRDPEVRRLDSGSMVATFSVATTEVYNDKSGNRQEQTEWHNIAVWGKPAEIAEKYLKKGSSVYIEGRIRSRDYTDKNTNQQKRFYEIVCDRFQMLDRKTDGSMSSASSSSPVSSEVSSGIDEPVDDLPF